MQSSSLIENSKIMVLLHFFKNVTKPADVYGRVSCTYAIRCGYPHHNRETCFACGYRNSYN